MKKYSIFFYLIIIVIFLGTNSLIAQTPPPAPDLSLTQYPAIKLKAKKSGAILYDETVIYFYPLATYAFDSDYDACKQFSQSSSLSNIFSIDTTEKAL